jgi:hypothetical protein
MYKKTWLNLYYYSINIVDLRGSILFIYQKHQHIYALIENNQKDIQT